MIFSTNAPMMDTYWQELISDPPDNAGGLHPASGRALDGSVTPKPRTCCTWPGLLPEPVAANRGMGAGLPEEPVRAW